MKGNHNNVVSLVLVLVALASLVSMVAALMMDRIVHGDLYRYGLQFDPDWAAPYWRMKAIVFSMGWLIVIASLGLELDLVMRRRLAVSKVEVPEIPQQPIKDGPPTTEPKSCGKIEEAKAENVALALKPNQGPHEIQLVFNRERELEKTELTSGQPVEMKRGKKESEQEATSSEEEKPARQN